MSRFTLALALAAALLGPVLILIVAGAVLSHLLWRHRHQPRT
jgi:hypothetical protein